MHDWLFGRRGQFTTEQLDVFASEICLPLDAIHNAMASEEVLSLIGQDCSDAHAAGLRFTPMMLLDGVEVNAQ